MDPKHMEEIAKLVQRELFYIVLKAVHGLYDDQKPISKGLISFLKNKLKATKNSCFLYIAFIKELLMPNKTLLFTPQLTHRKIVKTLVEKPDGFFH